MTRIPALDWAINGLLVTIVLTLVGQFAMYIGQGYATLKHRIFNFDFAISERIATDGGPPQDGAAVTGRD